MHITAYLFFNGNCKEVLEFYGKAIGATTDYIFTYGASPAAAHMPPEMHDKVINAAFRIGDSLLMASDCPPGKACGDPAGFSICINVSSVAEAETIFNGLAGESRAIVMALGPTFFAEAFGQLIDKFGVNWMVIFEKKAA